MKEFYANTNAVEIILEIVPENNPRTFLIHLENDPRNALEISLETIPVNEHGIDSWKRSSLHVFVLEIQMLIPENCAAVQIETKPGYFWQGKKSSVILHRRPQSRKPLQTNSAENSIQPASITLLNTMPSIPAPPLSVIMVLNLHTVNLERFS